MHLETARVLLLVVAVFTAQALPAQSLPSFSGVWKQSDDRSQPARKGDITLKIDHRDPELAVETTILRGSGAPRVAKQQYTTDSKPSTSTGADNDEFLTSIAWKDNELVVSIEEHEDGCTLRSSETWSLIEGWSRTQASSGAVCRQPKADVHLPTPGHKGSRPGTDIEAEHKQSSTGESRMRVLVIEDESKTAKFLKKGLCEAGFLVEVATDGLDGLEQAQGGEFDLIILDVMLPRLDGWHVLARMRESGSVLPVLFLTARDAVYERVKGFELGADDYLVKPFAFSELLARVRSLLRRAQQRPHSGQQETLRLADLEIDVPRQRATRAGHRLDLTAKEFLLLSLFARRPGEVLSRTLIAESVWDMNFDSDTNVVDVNVRRLRSKVDDPFPVKLIHTRRGAGYVMAHDQ